MLAVEAVALAVQLLNDHEGSDPAFPARVDGFEPASNALVLRLFC